MRNGKKVLRAFRGLSGVTLTSAPAWKRPEAALARCKALNHYPIVATYFWQVRYAGSSTGLPPSIEVAECGALSVLLVSECLRRVWRRRIEYSGGAAAWTQTLCVMCEYYIGVTTLEDKDEEEEEEDEDNEENED